MIWFKRAVPFLILLAGWLIYSYGTDYMATKHQAEQDRMARAVAECWLLRAEFADDTTGFVSARDSVLSRHAVNPALLDTFLAGFDGRDETMLPFLEQVDQIVDSLTRLKLDSIDQHAADSARRAR